MDPSNTLATEIDRPVAAFDAARSAGAALPTRKIALGEELPIFCEKCGFALHGLPQHVCERCTIRQFHCPECGHHQPINTLRPAAQKMLGRVRSFFLALSVLFKLNFFGWLLVAWFAMGYEWSYAYQYEQSYSMPMNPGRIRSGQNYPRYAQDHFMPRELDLEQMLAFGMFALAFGMFGRMLLLRWRKGYWVGLSLSGAVCLAVVLGALWRKMVREGEIPISYPFTKDFVICVASTAVILTLGSSVVWGIWTALAYLFLPKRTSQALLEWQRTLSNPSAASLARD